MTTWTYDGANDVLSETDPTGANGYAPVTQDTYDASGDLTQQVAGYVSGAAASSDTNVTTSYTYDSYGEVLTETDPLGIVTKYVYDNQGDVTETIANYVSGGAQDSQTNVATFATYDALGQELTATNAVGVVTQNTYDLRGNLMQTVANWVQGTGSNSTTNVTTQYGYDPLGRQVSVTNPLGVVTETVYDADGRTTTTWQDCVDCLSPNPTTDSQTNVTTATTYDAAGNATLTTDAVGNTTATTYDADNRATEVKRTSGPNASPASSEVQDTRTVYDADGHTSSSTVYDFAHNGANSQTTTYTYDAAGRQATQTDPSGLVTTTSYDALGNATETKQTFTFGGTTLTIGDTTATFDHLGRMLSKVENPNVSGGQTTTYTYDADGRQLSLKDTAGNLTSSSYDALGRVVTVTHPYGTHDTTTYDADGHRLTQANAAGTTTDTYDPLGRLSSEQQADGTGVVQSTVSYTYDAEGNKLSQTTTPAGGSASTTSWTYDKLNRPATLSDGTRSYTYDAAGNVTQMQVFTNGTQTVQAQYQHDGANRLTSLKDYVGPGSTNPLHNYSYAYDAAGNRNSITEDGTTTTYTYDGSNQLLTVTSGGVTQASYTYDSNHNRTKLVTPAGTTTYTYDSSATDTLLQQKTDPNGKVTKYTYDPNGNLTTATYDPNAADQQITTYKYDSSNRLTEIDEPSGTTVTFAYDANGQRIKKTTQTGGANATMTVVNDTYHNGRLAYQTNLGGTVLATFTYDPNGVPESVVVGADPVNGPRYYYVYNGHGDVAALTDASGNVVASYSYDVWGNLTSSSETIPNANGWTNPYRYDGKDGARYDTETGLYWLTTRAYDPTLGRFLQRDPLGRMPLFFWNQPYVYAGNNPLINVDPSGERYYDGLLGSHDETAQQQIAQTRRTQRMAPRHPSGGCRGGCNAKVYGGSSGSTGKNDKIHTAEGIAGTMGWTFGFIAAGLGALAGLVELLNAVLQTDAFANILSIFGAALGLSEEVVIAQLNVLTAFIAALGLEAGILTVMFAWEANQADSWWAKPGNLSDFAGTVEAFTGAFMAIFGAISLIVRKVIGGLPAGAKWANFGLQIGSAIASLGSIIFAGMAIKAVNDEQHELGYA